VTHCVIRRLRIPAWVLRCEDPSLDDLPMPANVELRIASQLLQALLPQSGTRDAAEREVDAQHALDVAKILLRRFAASPGSQAPQALTYSPSTNGASRAAPVDRDQVPQSFPSTDAWRAARGLPPVKPAPTRVPSAGPGRR